MINIYDERDRLQREAGNLWRLLGAQEAITKAACIRAVSDCYTYTDEYGWGVYDCDLEDTINAVNIVGAER
jgi:hypothetical protein